MKTSEMQELWVVERHSAGGYRVTPVLEMVERNGQAAMRGENSGYMVLALAPGLEAAREMEREIKRKVRANGLPKFFEGLLPRAKGNDDEI